MNSQIASEISVESAKARRSTRALAVLSLGPLTAVAGLAWALLQPYRITLLHPHGQGFWWLFVEPPLLVVLVGVLFHLLVAPGVVEDLEEGDSPHAPGAPLAKEASGRRAGQYDRHGQAPSAPHPAASVTAWAPRAKPDGGCGLRPAEQSRRGA